ESTGLKQVTVDTTPPLAPCAYRFVSAQVSPTLNWCPSAQAWSSLLEESSLTASPHFHRRHALASPASQSFFTSATACAPLASLTGWWKSRNCRMASHSSVGHFLRCIQHPVKYCW